MTTTLAECPVGLFISANGELCLKTEYSENNGRITAYIVSSGEFFCGAQPQTIRNQRASIVTPVSDLLRKSREMRSAIDLMEGALMGYGELTALPDLFEGARDDLVIHPKVTVGEMRRVCEALSECTRIVNADEFTDFIKRD